MRYYSTMEIFTNKYHYHIGCSVLLHLPDPVGNRFKCPAAADVVGHHGSMCTAVVALCYGAETLLSGCVPHLHLKDDTAPKIWVNQFNSVGLVSSKYNWNK